MSITSKKILLKLASQNFLKSISANGGKTKFSARETVPSMNSAAELLVIATVSEMDILYEGLNILISISIYALMDFKFFQGDT